MKHKHVSSLPVFAATLQLFASRFSSLRELFLIVVMSLAVVGIYWPPPAEPDVVQMGLDYWQLHSRRMAFAREGLFGPARVLPAWYPRELLGTPFWSRWIQLGHTPMLRQLSFPQCWRRYSLYLYLRKVGVGLTGATAAGWTFACSGYYASRVAAGHLPLLEAYPALPLRLWIVESIVQAQERGEPLRGWIGAAAICSTCVVLAGHPQLPVYAMSITSLYSLWRGGVRRAVWVWAAMAVGVGVAAFALVPMAMLISCSTRVLALAAPLNDLSMPLGRLVAFFLPWHDGVPPLLDPAGVNPFHGYPTVAYFWDTVCYTGLLPWFAVALLFCFAGRLKPDRPVAKIALFVVVLGVAGIVLSLPSVHQLMSLIPGGPSQPRDLQSLV